MQGVTMAEPTSIVPRDGSGDEQRAEGVLRDYLGDPLAPRPEEVRRLVRELTARQAEFEAQLQQLRQTQRQLEEFRDRYVDLYDSAPLGYATLDEDGFVQEINLAGAKMLGEDREAITGYAFGDYVAPEHQKVFQEHVRKCAGERAEVTSELRLVAKGGRSMAVQLRSMPIEGPREDALCKTAITDITQLKNMGEEVRQSRAFLQTVIDAIPDVLLVIGQDYRISLANRAAREMAGGIDPTLCLTCHQFSHHRALPCEGLREPCPLREVIASRAPVRVTHTHYDATGNEVFVELSAAPVFNAAGEVTHIVEACHDVTDRTRLERALRLTQFSVDRAGDAVFWVGPNARFFYVNARACQHLGYSREELLSMSVHDVDPGFPAEIWPQHWEELKRRGSLTFESQHRTREGRLVPVQITANHLEFEGKEYDCAVVRDITDRKQAEEAMKAAKDFAEQANRAKDRFLAVLGHELRTPLTPLVMGFSMLQERPDLDPTTRRTLEMVPPQRGIRGAADRRLARRVADRAWKDRTEPARCRVVCDHPSGGRGLQARHRGRGACVSTWTGAPPRPTGSRPTCPASSRSSGTC